MGHQPWAVNQLRAGQDHHPIPGPQVGLPYHSVEFSKGHTYWLNVRPDLDVVLQEVLPVSLGAFGVRPENGRIE
jgi:hypothetical protein